MKNKYIIIFRSMNYGNNLLLENATNKFNYAVKAYPILELKKLRRKKINVVTAQAICTSSINGILLLAELIDIRDIKIFTMGESSKKVARQCGFKNVIDCGGDSARMINIILKNTVKGNGEIIYAGAKTLSVNFPKILKGYGYNVRRFFLYETTPIKELDKDFVKKVNKRQISWIILLSQKGAKNCGRLLYKYFPIKKIQSIKFACLSSKIANCLPSYIINKFYPKSSNTYDLLELIDSENRNGC